MARHLHVAAADVEAHVEAIVAEREREWLRRRLAAHAWPLATAPRDLRCAWCGAVLVHGSTVRGVRLRLVHPECHAQIMETAT